MFPRLRHLLQDVAPLELLGDLATIVARSFFLDKLGIKYCFNCYSLVTRTGIQILDLHARLIK